MEMPATESRVHGGEGIFENVNTISSSECSGDLATYVKHFMKSPGKIEAISPGHGFKNGDLPESDDENMDRAAPRFVGVDLHGDGIRIAATADLHSNQLNARFCVSVICDSSSRAWYTGLSCLQCFLIYFCLTASAVH